MPGTPLEILVRDHIGDNSSGGFGSNVSSLQAVAEYLRTFCPAEDDLLLFSEHRAGATDTGRLFAVTATHVMLLNFGVSDDGGRSFTISGPALRLDTVSAVRLLSESTAWSDGASGVTIDPSIEIGFSSGDKVTIGRNGDFAWQPRSKSNFEIEMEARSALLTRLMN